ncbi:MAG: PQQ-binding-like beta-propeller repeat protein [Phycisphaerales bacterium]|jgi:outer membrane protein assembly factor BamB|nr:PQQ-binding-like beta-propeller repeat protein [Phycisphaerales bacterium]
MRKIPFVSLLATVALATTSALSDGKTDTPASMGTTHGVNLQDLREISYRIDWVNQETAADLHLATLTDSKLYAIDTFDHLVCYDLKNGSWLWSTPVGNRIYALLGINANEEARQVYVNADGAVYAFESDTGMLPTFTDNPMKDATDKPVQKLRWSANTPAILSGSTLLYGSRNGNLVWHDCSIGFSSRTYSIADSMQIAPTISGDIVVATGGKGSVAAIDLKNSRSLWLMELLDAIVVSPTINHGTVYIAGTDQYLRAVDLYTGRPRWKYLTTAELVDAPVVIDDALYQQIPGAGLTSFSAFAPDITGEKRWTSPKVTGNVITTTKDDRLLCWDAKARVLQVVDPKHGSVTYTMALPLVQTLLVDSLIGGNLYLVTDDDAIIKLIPRLSN